MKTSIMKTLVIGFLLIAVSAYSSAQTTPAAISTSSPDFLLWAWVKVITVLVLLGVVTFFSISYFRRKRKSEKKREGTARQRTEAKQMMPSLSKKLKEEGLEALNVTERNLLIRIVDYNVREPEDLSVEEVELVQTALADSITYRFLRLKQADSVAQKQMVVAKKQEEQQKKTNSYLKVCSIAAFAFVLYTTINWFLHGHWLMPAIKFITP